MNGRSFRCIFMVSMVAAAGVSTAIRAAAQNDKSEPKNHDKSVYAKLAEAPEKARSRANPMQDDPEALAGGAKLFDLHCANCHGEMADGGKKGPSLRAEPVQQATPGALFWILTNGVVRRGMPVWSKLPEPQRWQLVSYLKSLSPATQPAQGHRAEDRGK